MEPCLYTGQVRHSRFRPKLHRFSYGIHLVLANIEGFDNGQFGGTRPWWMRALLPLRRRDHLKGHATADASLRDVLADMVNLRGGISLDEQGDVFLLTGLGFLWHRFNPASFYFCVDRYGQLQCLVAEVTNTPWKEQSHYVLDARDQRGAREMQFSCPKDFHVSPFMPMDTVYHWRLAAEGNKLLVNINVERQSLPLFNAALDLAKRPLNVANLLAAVLNQPLMSLGVSMRIYWQAMRLWLKSTPFFPHPRYSSGDKL